MWTWVYQKNPPDEVACPCNTSNGVSGIDTIPGVQQLANLAYLASSQARKTLSQTKKVGHTWITHPRLSSNLHKCVHTQISIKIKPLKNKWTQILCLSYKESIQGRELSLGYANTHYMGTCVDYGQRDIPIRKPQCGRLVVHPIRSHSSNAKLVTEVNPVNQSWRPNCVT